MAEYEDDWDLINAYADCELPAEEMRLVARRLTQESALAAMLAEVQKAKAGLSLLSPPPCALSAEAPVELPTPSLYRRRRRAAFCAIVAAAVVVLAVATAARLPPVSSTEEVTGWHDVVFALHEEFSERAYALIEAPTIATISTASMGDISAFDLRASSLFLVDVESRQHGGQEVVTMHYRGRNGCRLTLTASPINGSYGFGKLEEEGVETAHWTTGGTDYHLVATGMDVMRFAAIAAYAEAESERRENVRMLKLALEGATESAAPCA